MNTENKIPKVFIIAETKINPQSIENAIKEVKNLNWQDQWKKRNFNSQISELEKIPEAISEVVGTFENDNLKTEEYNKQILKIILDENPLQHLFVTVAFINVSKQFSFTFRKFGGQITTGEQNFEKFSFWVPPNIEIDNELLFEYGKNIHDYMQNVEKIQYKIIEKNKDFILKGIQSSIGLYPLLTQINMVATTNISEWKKMIICNTDFNANDENRFIFCQLFRLFSLKWPSIFSDLQLVDLDGNPFDVDTIQSSSNTFKGVQVVYVQ